MHDMWGRIHLAVRLLLLVELCEALGDIKLRLACEYGAFFKLPYVGDLAN